MLQSSLSLFSIGVPVSANLALLLISFTAFAAAVDRFYWGGEYLGKLL